MPHSPASAIPRAIRPATDEAPALPALNGRSVRNLRRVGVVRSARRTAAIVVGLFGVSVTLGLALPAYAQVAAPTASVSPLQSFSVDLTTPVLAAARDSYGVTTPPPLQWPVAETSPIASDFGPRVSPCSGCSSFHEGVDFDAGYGTAVHAIAAGVVVETNNPGWVALGVHVAIQHVLDGVTIVSAYGHLQAGSMPLKVGDTVFAGQQIGRVGDTGASTGPHLHFEIRLAGTTPTDPLAWMHVRLG